MGLGGDAAALAGARRQNEELQADAQRCPVDPATPTPVFQGRVQELQRLDLGIGAVMRTMHTCSPCSLSRCIALTLDCIVAQVQ